MMRLRKMVEYVHGKTIRGVSGKIISTFIINLVYRLRSAGLLLARCSIHITLTE